MTPPLTTILIPMRNEEGFIAECLSSLQHQDYPADRLEIVVLDGDSTDRSPEIVREIAVHDPRVRLLPNPGRSQAHGMNVGIAAALGEIIVRADAHAIYGPSYVAACVEHLTAGRADNVGGPQRAVSSTLFGKAVAAAMASPLGAGNAPYRLSSAPRYADTVWLGAWRRQTLLDIGGYDPVMVPNEDYEMNCRLRAQGGRILFDPSLPSTYYPRTSPPHLWRQYFRYGQAKIRTLRAHPWSLVLRQLAVPVFLLALMACAALLPLSPWPLVGLGGLYLAAVLLGSAHTASRAGWPLLPLLPLVYLTMHFAWGLGFYWGILRHGPFPLRLRGLIASERLVRNGGQPRDSLTPGPSPKG
jgi:succinoglycan biosynthesis protein ExoA